MPLVTENRRSTKHFNTTASRGPSTSPAPKLRPGTATSHKKVATKPAIPRAHPTRLQSAPGCSRKSLLPRTRDEATQTDNVLTVVDFEVLVGPRASKYHIGEVIFAMERTKLSATTDKAHNLPEEALPVHKVTDNLDTQTSERVLTATPKSHKSAKTAPSPKPVPSSEKQSVPPKTPTPKKAPLCQPLSDCSAEKKQPATTHEEQLTQSTQHLSKKSRVQVPPLHLPPHSGKLIHFSPPTSPLTATPLSTL